MILAERDASVEAALDVGRAEGLDGAIFALPAVE